MNYILFDDNRTQLLPLTFTRPVAELRVGILTIREKWEKYLGASTSTITESYLQKKYPLNAQKQNILINGSILPNEQLVKEIVSLKEQEGLVQGKTIIAAFAHSNSLADFSPANVLSKYNTITSRAAFIQIDHLWDIFEKNGEALISDFELLTKNRTSQPLSSTNKILGKDNIFIEKGASIECAILNATTGPIYIGKDAEIMEGAMVRGPFALGEHSVLKLGAKIYGPTTVGPYSRVGGEVTNGVIMGYSNKAHDGFLGNAVIGHWCNLGADTNNSNLKNNYAQVKMWSYESEKFVPTGLQFCGLIMGDHAKCGINTMFNTGTVVGVNANIFGAGFPRNFIPSFSWGGAGKSTTYEFNKAIEVAKMVYKRRDKIFDEQEIKILKHIFEQTAKYRH